MSRRRSPTDPLTGALAGAARACGSGGPAAAAILAQGPDVQPLLEAFEARRWQDASRFRDFDLDLRQRCGLLAACAGPEPCAAAAVLDPLEPYANAQLVRPPVSAATAQDLAALAELRLVGDWKPL